MQEVDVGLTGVGGRGQSLIEELVKIDAVNIVSICDRLADNRAEAADLVETKNGNGAETHGAQSDMLASTELDAVLIATDWRPHIELAIEAMRMGVTPAMEVGPANTVRECWRLVECREETNVPCMLLENYCFKRNNMAALQMARNGLFGTLVHCQGGYGHDLRQRLVEGKGTGITREGGGDYRSQQVESRNADLYPTHGLGPLAKILDINRGNRIVSLTATPSRSAGLSDWTAANRDSDHPKAETEWANGDVVTTVLKTAEGQTITLYHDTVLPRPMTDFHRVQGTEGIWEASSDQIYIDEQSPPHEWEAFEDYRHEFEHPLWERARSESVELGDSGHWGSDILMLRSFIESVKQGCRPPIDVYDAATWMAIAPLTEQSIAKGTAPVSVPDFTNGSWLDASPIFGMTHQSADPLNPKTIL
jgi:predicted dehydrogenase